MILRVLQDRDPEVAVPAFALEAGLEGLITRRVVDDQHLDVAAAQFVRDAIEHALDRFLRVIGNDEDQDAFVSEIDHRI